LKVAILGAGLSGLACAITLEKNGIEPAVFEHRSRVGDRFINGEAMLSLLNRPVQDSIAFLSEQHGIYLKPTAHIRRLSIHSANEQAVIEGRIGFSNLRGRDEDSFEAQLGRQLRTPIRFHSTHTYEELVQEYTHVIVATGDGKDARRLHNYTEDLSVTLRGATVEGEFDPYSVTTWLDYDMIPKGYGYIIPFSSHEASVAIAMPDLPDGNTRDTDSIWDAFFRRVCKDLGQELKVTDQFEVSGYSIGCCADSRIGNSFFVGNNFGSVMPFLGFGQFSSLLTGIYAAYDLCGKGSYEELTAPLRRSYSNSLVLRRSMESLSNEQLDRIVKAMNGYIGQKLFNTKTIDVLKHCSYLLRPYVMLQK
jgi:flavin-dependent dehydrogenase